ncbi:MAG TPA: polysaccharide deacetylase family protein [Chitinophagaceae bacterium]|nr:polysaccharide deacetylase family protein [Chitinophagaceae bacterium]
MDPDNQGAAQTASFFLRTTLLFVCLAVYQRSGKGTIRINPSSFTAKQPVAVASVKPAAKKKKKKIYLTFDDGPNKGTQKVLHIMQEEAVPVTFFIIGEHVFASAGQQQTWDSLKMAKQIELCNHSYTHAEHNHFEAYYNEPDSVVNDFKRSQDSLQLDNNVCRTPGRNTWRIDTLQYTDLKKSKNAVDSLEKAGFAIMGWDLEWHYNPSDLSLQNTADDLLRQIDSVFAHHKTRSPERLVLLAHDQVYADVNDSVELHNFIRMLKLNEDYELELVSNYPGIKN